MIPDPQEANKIHNKSYPGIPQSGGGLQLQVIEALYLIEKNQLEIFYGKKELTMQELIQHATKKTPMIEIFFIVYRDLRSRGFVVKPQLPNCFNVYERGVNPKRTPFTFKILPITERAPFVFNDLVKELSATRSLRKELIAAIVDEEGDLTYYSIDLAVPQTKLKRRKTTRSGEAIFVEDRILVWDEKLIHALHDYEFYGKLLDKTLQLSLIEGFYLLDNGIIELRNIKTNRKIGRTGLKRLARDIQPDFDMCNSVYRKLKELGLIVKTGFKYGTHFRVYKGHPDSEHSDYLVHAVPPNFESTWPEVSRAVRLAHGVRKEMLFSRIKKGELENLKISRIKL
jgi:tRNA-intron endonuclease